MRKVEACFGHSVALSRPSLIFETLHDLGFTQQTTRSRTVISEICEVAMIVALAQALFEAVNLEGRNVRLLGISLSNLGSEERPLRGSQIESSMQLVLF